jgi:hypothetical protein
VSSLAKAEGRTRLEVAYDHMCTRDATGTIWRGSPDVVGWCARTHLLAHASAPSKIGG